MKTTYSVLITNQVWRTQSLSAGPSPSGFQCLCGYQNPQIIAHVFGVWQHALPESLMWSSQQPSDVRAATVPISEMRRGRHTKANYPAQGHLVYKVAETGLAPWPSDFWGHLLTNKLHCLSEWTSGMCDEWMRSGIEIRTNQVPQPVPRTHSRAGAEGLGWKWAPFLKPSDVVGKLILAMPE